MGVHDDYGKQVTQPPGGFAKTAKKESTVFTTKQASLSTWDR